MDVVTVEHLSKSFGPVRVLEDVSFSVHRGEVLAVIGPSGSGKSALPRAITHLELYVLHRAPFLEAVTGQPRTRQAAHDRVEGETIPLNQDYLAEMLGVQRTSVSPIAKQLQDKGLIRYRRGRIEIVDRTALERGACECYRAVERHFTAVLPEPRPQKLIDAGGGMA